MTTLLSVARLYTDLGRALAITTLDTALRRLRGAS